MSSPSPLPVTAATSASLRPRWTQLLNPGLRGLALARERYWLLAWDEQGQLHLLNRDGQRQGQTRLDGLRAASIADDGSACAATGSAGQIWWLAPDLTPKWQRMMPGSGLAAALDPFGQYLAVASTRGDLHLFDRHGRTVWKATTPRPLLHLAFLPTTPFLVGAADFGLVVCFDMPGQLVWRDGLVAHIGALAVSAEEGPILACFGQGLVRYEATGRKLSPLPFQEPCRLVARTFDGRQLLTANLEHRLFLLTANGQVLTTHSLGQPVAGLVLAALGEQVVAACPGGAVVSLDVAK